MLSNRSCTSIHDVLCCCRWTMDWILMSDVATRTRRPTGCSSCAQIRRSCVVFDANMTDCSLCGCSRKRRCCRAFLLFWMCELAFASFSLRRPAQLAGEWPTSALFTRSSRLKRLTVVEKQNEFEKIKLHQQCHVMGVDYLWAGCQLRLWLPQNRQFSPISSFCEK